MIPGGGPIFNSRREVNANNNWKNKTKCHEMGFGCHKIGFYKIYNFFFKKKDQFWMAFMKVICLSWSPLSGDGDTVPPHSNFRTISSRMSTLIFYCYFLMFLFTIT